jgi:hypothetical protein
VPGSASARLADGYLVTQLLHAAIALGLPEALADGPRDVAVLPDRAVDAPASVRMDLHMLLLLRGRERGVTEFGALFAAAGLDLTADVPTPAEVHVLEARPRGAQAERA